MNYNDELMRYQDDAEDRFDDFNDAYDSYDPDPYDDDDEDMDAGFEGNEDAYDSYEDELEDYEDYDDYEDDDYEEDGYIGAMDEQYDAYRMTSVGRIDPNDRTLTVVVKNTSDNATEAIIFGGNQDATQPNGVSVDVEESSHKEVREESKANPFKIAGMKYSVSNALQFDNVLKITRRTASGSNTVRVYQPRNATSPQNFTQSLIDDDNFEMEVTGQDSLRVLINGGTTAVFTFTIKARANMGNVLRGNNVAELSRVPRTTGLPQIDLIRRRRPSALGMRRRRPRRLRRSKYHSRSPRRLSRRYPSSYRSRYRRRLR